MRKIVIPFLALCIIACSVDREELNLNSNEIQGLNSQTELELCEPDIHYFGEAGRLEVTNTSESLYISVISSPGYSLNDVKYHVANNVDDFPTVGQGQGNLPPGQMEYTFSFEDGRDHHTLEFALDDLSECFNIASNATFSNGEDAVNTWAGDIKVKRGNWAYFEYCEQTCEIGECDGIAGSDQSIDIPLAIIEPEAFGLSDLRIYLYDHLYRQAEISGNGIYSPTLTELFHEYQKDLTDPSINTYSYVTEYGLDTGGCVDSAEITINIVP